MNIEHDRPNNRFFVASNGTVAYVEYIENESTFEVTHTEVPKEMTGKGIANQLVKYAFDYAQNRDLLFAPSCEYALLWLEKGHFNKSPKEL